MREHRDAQCAEGPHERVQQQADPEGQIECKKANRSARQSGDHAEQQSSQCHDALSSVCHVVAFERAGGAFAGSLPSALPKKRGLFQQRSI
jgi:hypothetical protein